MYLERSRTISKHLFNLTFTRAMGGGPRTFPGGLNKWQWKRLHEKKAREKENKLLEQEKQMYQARVRSQIRAKLAGKPEQERPSPVHGSSSSSVHGPMSPKEHISALADRFMKEGAEDLWNDDDGTVESPPPRSPSNVRSSERSGSIGSLIDVRRLISENRHGLEHNNAKNEHWMNSNGSMRSMHYSVQPQISGRKPLFDGNSLMGSCDSVKPRHYSVHTGRRFRRNESSSSDDDLDFGLENGPVKDFVGNSRFPRLSVNGGKSPSDTDMKLRSSAALGKHDVKIKRRVPLKNFDEGNDFSEQVELIRHELKKKNLMEKDVEMGNEESLLSEKSFVGA